MQIYALVAIGGAIGSLTRFWLTLVAARLAGPGFPWGTIGINVAGSFAIGWFAVATFTQGRAPGAADLRAFLIAGLCGGFTTFSAFSLQTLELWRGGQAAAAFGNALGSVVLCVAATALGMALGRA